MRTVLEGLPQLDLEQLTPIHPDAAEAWQQRLQQPLQPANCCYTPPRQLHIQQHDHVPLHWQPTQSQQHLQGAAGNLGGVLLQQDPGLWRAYQVLSFISHVCADCSAGAGRAVDVTWHAEAQAQVMYCQPTSNCTGWSQQVMMTPRNAIGRNFSLAA